MRRLYGGIDFFAKPEVVGGNDQVVQ